MNAFFTIILDISVICADGFDSLSVAGVLMRASLDGLHVRVTLEP